MQFFVTKDLTFSGVLFIKIEPDVNPNVIGVLFQAIKEMEAKTLIRFKMLTNEEDGISINPHAGCTSHVGRQGGIQSLSLAYNENGRCDSMATIMHEFMHALGVQHTQTRPDRDEYVTIIEENVDPAKFQINFNMVEDYEYRNRIKIIFIDIT